MKRAFCKITISGQDVTSNFDPRLISVSVSLSAGQHSHTARIKVDDRDGSILLPQSGDPVSILLGWEIGGSGGAGDVVFVGTIDEVKSSGARGGMYLDVTAKSADTTKKPKHNQQRHFDNKSVKSILEEAGRDADVSSVEVHPSLASKIVPYLDMRDESFLHLGQRIAQMVGGTFTMSGDKAQLTERNSGQSASGQTLPTVTAARGLNLHSWDLAPIQARPQFRKARVRYYDRKTATYRESTVDVETDASSAEETHRYTGADEGEATDRATNEKKTSERDKGGGSVTIEGEPAAMPEGKCQVSGTRPGIDGEYKIESVEHDYSRSGFTTKLELRLPGGGAGSDSRGGGAGSGGGSGSSGGGNPYGPGGSGSILE